MDFVQAIILGLTQGLTEFLPVSSSGHLELVQEMMGGRTADFRVFLEFINFGSLLALLIFYRYKLAEIFSEIFKKRNYTLLRNLIITILPVSIVGFIFAGFINTSSFFASLTTMMVAMSIIGALLIFIDKLPRFSKLKDEYALTPGRAAVIGFSQIFALIPGVSRVGSTMIAGRLVGLGNRAAAEYSFLVSIPILLGVVFRTLFFDFNVKFLSDNFNQILCANIIALLAGLFILRRIFRFLKRRDSLQLFGWYRLVLAAIMLIFWLTK